MSIKIMTEVWEHAPVKGGDLLVLLALADWAGDTRQAYPGVKNLAKKARLSERQTQYAIAKLTKLGLISVRRNASPLKTNLYQISSSLAPETQYLHPPQEKPETQLLRIRDAAHCVSETQPIAPKPPVTTSIEPSVIKADKISDILCTILSKEVADDFIAHRKAKKSRLTERAAQLIVKKLRECREPEAAIERSIMNGWTGVFPEESKGARNGQQQSGADIAQRAAERWTARKLDSRASASPSQPLLSAGQSDRCPGSRD